MRDLNYNHLRYFWVVAHEGSLTRAAERMHLSQSALSVQIQKLEHQMGHPLFERIGKKLVLTEAGKIALDYADTVFEAGEELMSTLRGRPVASRQVLRVGALTTLSRNFQLEFLRPLVGRSDVELIVRSGNMRDLVAQLEAHAIDVVLANSVAERDARSSLRNHLLDEQPVGLVGRPRPAATGTVGAGLALAGGRPDRTRKADADAAADRGAGAGPADTGRTGVGTGQASTGAMGPGLAAPGSAGKARAFRFPEDLATEPLLLPSLDSAIRVAFDRVLERFGIRPIILAEVDDMAMLRLLARERDGATLVPPIVVRDELESGVLVEFCRIPEVSETFYAIVQNRRFPNRLLEDLIPTPARPAPR